MAELMNEWYLFVSQLSAALSQPLQALAERVEAPVLSSLLFGILGSTAPCQLTTKLSALAYVSKGVGPPTAPIRAAGAYTLGKVAAYTGFGILAWGVGSGLNTAAIPVIQVVRKALGPLMIVIGLALLGLLARQPQFGPCLSAKLAARIPGRGVAGSFLLGFVFSLAFCPTLFWLFFGLTLPLALVSPVGWAFPGVFAAGTAIPLLVGVGFLAAGSAIAETSLQRMSRINRLVTPIAGAIFLVAGINDTLTYWWI
jgi:cytochrome c biogenesis protein CcdA